MIEATVTALLAQDYQPMEVVVVDDRSTDRTPELLKRIAEADSRLKVVRGSEPPEGWLGKPWALHQGVQSARGELLLFIDADVIYGPGAISSVVGAWRESGAAMVTIFPRVEMRGFWENVLMPQLAMMAFVFFPTWLSNRTRIVQLGLGGGPGNLVERSVYEEIGGHEALRDAVIDDIGMAWRVRRHGHRSVAVRGGEHLRLRMYRGFGEIVEGFTKNVYTALGGTLPAALMSLAVMTVIHFAPFLLFARALWHFAAGEALDGADLLGVVTVALITTARLIVFLSLRYSLLSAIFAYPLSLPVWGWIVLRSTWNVGVLGRLTWRGRTYRSKSTRFGGG